MTNTTSELFEKAAAFAVLAHSGQKRKSKEKPYILHPLEVAAIAGTYTDDQEILAAAVLHDTVEDTGVTIETIEGLFGKRVAQLVAAESEDKQKELPAESTWQERKQATITHLQNSPDDVKLICLGDKLANIREMAADYRKDGDALWQRFNQKDKAMHGWYYSGVYKALGILAESDFKAGPALEEYGRLLKEVFGIQIETEE